MEMNAINMWGNPVKNGCMEARRRHEVMVWVVRMDGGWITSIDFSTKDIDLIQNTNSRQYFENYCLDSQLLI
jgi:predicted RNA-binding protein associated with RNAse of E/G family